WDGRTLADRAYLVYWSHNLPSHDWFMQWQDIGGEFRADEGFIPQVGYREPYFQAGYTVRPKRAFYNRIRFFNEDYVDLLPGGDVLTRHVQIGAGGDGKLSSFTRIELNRDEFRVGGRLLQRFRPHLHFDVSLSRTVNQLALDADVGDEIDFANARRAKGTTLVASASLRPGNHTEISAPSRTRWLNVHDGPQVGRLFVAQVERLRTTYTINAQSFVRLIAQHVRTDRDPTLYTFSGVEPRTQDVSVSGLFAYKVNWQTVLY